jgi:hypothetical protein
MTARDLVESSKMGETWCSDLTSVWSLATITDDVDTHLSLWCLNGRVGLSGWHSVSLGEEQEVVDESLHVLLHGRSWWWRNLVIFHTDWTSWHLVQALVDDAKRLAELLHSAKVTIVAVTVLANWDVEFHLVVCVVRLALANIPWDTGASEHDTSEGVVQGIGSRNNSNTSGSANPDTVVGQKLLGLIDTITELSSPLVNIIEQTDWDILVDTTWSDICGVKTGS